MKSTGIVRNIDDLGRVTLPIELRRTLGIKEKDSIEFYTDNDKIILKKYKANMECAVSGEVSDDNYILLGGKLILSAAVAEKLINEINLK